MIADPDLAYLRLAIHDLNDYLQSPELFWPLPSTPTSLGEPGLQQLTLGGLLLSLAKVEAAEVSESNSLRGRINSVRAQWRATWSQKAAREYQSRLELWRRSMVDILGNRVAQGAAYPSRVRVRVMLDLLLPEIALTQSNEGEILVNLDAQLHVVTRPGPFVWESEFASGFPRDRYWYLYVQF